MRSLGLRKSNILGKYIRDQVFVRLILEPPIWWKVLPRLERVSPWCQNAQGIPSIRAHVFKNTGYQEMQYARGRTSNNFVTLIIRTTFSITSVTTTSLSSLLVHYQCTSLIVATVVGLLTSLHENQLDKSAFSFLPLECPYPLRPTQSAPSGAPR